MTGGSGRGASSGRRRAMRPCPEGFRRFSASGRGGFPADAPAGKPPQGTHAFEIPPQARRSSGPGPLHDGQRRAGGDGQGLSGENPPVHRAEDPLPAAAGAALRPGSFGIRSAASGRSCKSASAPGRRTPASGLPDRRGRRGGRKHPGPAEC